jgi:ABC-2 type transport system permease protein
VGIFVIVSVAVGTLLGMLVKSQAKLTMISQLIFLPSIMLSGIMFPVKMLPKVLRTVGMIFPASWGFKLMTSSAFRVEFLMPLVAIMGVSIIIIIYKIVKIDLN